MNREESLSALAEADRWDVLVVGGGATGLGAAVDAAARGYRTVLLEAQDFAAGTSSRSTKLIHGGVRYLRQGNISLVRESLRERAILLRNAPHLAHRQAFLVPAYSRYDQLFYGVGLKLYDALAGKLSLGPSEIVSREAVLQAVPTLQDNGLKAGVRYYDGQFDDARLAICLAQKICSLGGFALNYLAVDRLLKNQGKVDGAVAHDVETGREFEIRARVTINATGVFTDTIRRFDQPGALPLVAASQGAHIVVNRSFLPGDTALMVPKTRDGRVLFAIPWMGRTVIGTTDTPVESVAVDPKPLEQEIEFLLEHAGLYLSKAPTRGDIVGSFAGLRPLVKTVGKNTAQMSRDHTIEISPSGLVTITGGKWTTYRKMAQDVIDRAAAIGALTPQPCRTSDLRLDDKGIAAVVNEASQVTEAAIAGFVREEMARTVEDVLARRMRLALLDAKAAFELAPMVAEFIATELRRDREWKSSQVAAFRKGLVAG